MTATLTFNLPEETAEHSYAVAGLDALLAINDLESEIRSFLRYECGELKWWRNDEGRECTADADTLERVAELIRAYRQNRRLPELE